MRMRRHGGGEHGEGGAHGIDLAPMLDFVLNLLIFFIITAIFAKEVALDVSRPTGAPPPDDQSKPGIQIQILESGEVFFNNRIVDVRAVRANVEREKALNSEVGVTILAENASRTGVTMSVVDQVRLGGVYNIIFTTTQ